DSERRNGHASSRGRPRPSSVVRPPAPAAVRRRIARGEEGARSPGPAEPGRADRPIAHDPEKWGPVFGRDHARDEKMTFAKDSRTVAKVVPSPNHDGRGARVDILLMHYTGMQTGEDALARLTDRSAKVSSHYFVDEDGRVLQLVSEHQRAWHAGESSWKRAVDINARSIGIEIVNPGHEYGYRDFPTVQIDAVIALSRDIIARHHIRRERVLAHSDVAPLRKHDPGEKFPWARLAAAGIGLWVEP